MIIIQHKINSHDTSQKKSPGFYPGDFSISKEPSNSTENISEEHGVHGLPYHVVFRGSTGDSFLQRE